MDVRRLRDELLQTQDAGGPRGQFTFGNNQTSISGAAVQDQVNALASFLVDVPSSIQRDLAVQFPAYRAVMLFSYLQDKWQVSQKLTVDFGVRHDFYPPATPRLKGGFSNYDPANNTLVVAGYGNNPDEPRPQDLLHRLRAARRLRLPPGSPRRSSAAASA